MAFSFSACKAKIIIVMLALTVNCAYLVILYDILPSYTSSCWSHIPVAYNFYKYGTLTEQREEIEYKTQKAIPIKIYDVPEKLFLNDTVGYAFLVGSLWKLTGSLNLLDVQLLQIALFCLMMFLLYEIFFLLFSSSVIAFTGCLITVFWYHLVLMNVIPSRDIWGFYGGVVLSYVLLKFFLLKSYSYKKVFLAALFFAFCQFLRPNIFGQCLTLCITLFILFFLYRRKEMNSCFKAVGIVILINILFFWIPFVSFNKAVYGRYFVGPLGHALLASLGTVDNPWGLECNDEKIFAYVQETQQISGNDAIATSDAKMRQFLKLLKENPFVYIVSLCNTIREALFYELEALIHFFQKCFVQGSFFKDKVQEAFALSRGLFLLKILEHFSGKLLRLLGYCGLLLAIARRRYIPGLFLMGGVFLGMWMLVLSHFEDRYIIPFSWPFAGFAAYFLVFVGQLLQQKISRFRLGDSLKRKNKEQESLRCLENE